jgi:hypothetical protein
MQLFEAMLCCAIVLGFPVKARKRLLSVNRYDILRAGSPLLSDIFIYFQTKYFQTK